MKYRAGSWRALACGLLGVALTWCVVLPWIAARPLVRERLEWLDARGIDPSAMYYTELDAMDAILVRLEGRPADGQSID